MSETIEIVIDGEAFEGWKSVTIQRSFDALAAMFDFDFAEVPTDDPLRKKVLKGSTVEILLDGDLLLDGAINRRREQYDGGSHSLSVSGRDILSDLVDSSATNEPGQWTNTTPSRIAAALVSVFPELSWRSDLSLDGKPLETFSLETGETVFGALDRLARFLGAVVRSDGRGGAFFERPGSRRAPVALSRAANIEGGELDDDDSQRYSLYIGHSQGPTEAFWDAGSPGQTIRSQVADPGVPRFRPLLILAEAAAGEQSLTDRLQFESNVRAARSSQVRYTLPRWRLDGHVWDPGELVSIYDPILGIGTAAGEPVDMLLSSATLERPAGSGSRTRLEFMRPDAFQPEPPDPPPAQEGFEFWED